MSNHVLPISGRAARVMMSPFCHPRDFIEVRPAGGYADATIVPVRPVGHVAVYHRLVYVLRFVDAGGERGVAFCKRMQFFDDLTNLGRAVVLDGCAQVAEARADGVVEMPVPHLVQVILRRVHPARQLALHLIVDCDYGRERTVTAYMVADHHVRLALGAGDKEMLAHVA